jgi:predicted MFS family arabinose efflux permease
VPIATRSPAADVVRGSRKLPAGLALAVCAAAFFTVYLSAGALTPLLVEYQGDYGFAGSMLNLAFAVYAAGFLVAALVLGSLSDHLGRRPVLIASLSVQLGSSLMFLLGHDLAWVIAGRLVQGIAGGAATGAFSAAMVEYAPAANKRIGAVLGGVSLTGGLAIGSLVAGWAIESTVHANDVVFIVLIVMTALGGAGIAFSEETVTRTTGAVRSMVPQVAVPATMRGEFLAAAPVIAAVWMLAGLSGGLAPSMVSSVFHHHRPLLGGFAGFIAPAVGTLVGVLFANVPSRRAMLIGIHASIIGAVGIIVGTLAEVLPIMLLGQAVSGVAFGASFTAALGLLIPLALPHQRAGVVAAIYVVAYVAFGVPITIEGQLVGPWGQVPAVVAYTALTVLLAVLSLIGQLRIGRQHP